MKPSLLNSNNLYHFINNYSNEIGLFAHNESIYDNLLFCSKQKNKPTNTLTTSTCNNQISTARTSEFAKQTVTNNNISEHKSECTATSDCGFAHVSSHLPIESSYLPIESSQCRFERLFGRFGKYGRMGLEKYNDDLNKILKKYEFLQQLCNWSLKKGCDNVFVYYTYKNNIN